MFDVEFEKDVLAQALRDLDFARKAVPVLHTHSFSSDTFLWIWKVVREGVEKHRELPTPRIWAQRIKTDWKPAEQPHLLAALGQLHRRVVSAPRTSLDQIRDFIRLGALRRGFDEGLTKLEEGDLAAAEEAVAAGLLDARSARVLQSPSSGLDWSSRFDTYLPTAAVFRFAPGMPVLRRCLNGGLPPGRLALVIAQTNVGKSTMAVDFGWSSLVADPSTVVAHVTTEETEQEAFSRYDARASGIERSILLSGSMSATEQGLFRARMGRAEPLLARLRVQEFAPGVSSTMLWSFVEEVRQEFPTQPILLVVDSPDHLGPPSSAKAKDHRLQVAAVYWLLKALVKDDDLGPVAAWAVTWAKIEKGKMNANSASETAEKGRIADFMLGLSEGEDSGDEDWKEMVVDVLKNRVGRLKSFRFVAKANLGTCEFQELDVAEPP